MNDNRENWVENWDRWWLKVESVPLDAKKLAADVPQSPRRLFTSSLWRYKGRGAVTEKKGGGGNYCIRANDGVSHHSGSAVSSFLCDLVRD